MRVILPVSLILCFLFSEAHAGKPKCFMHGIITSVSGNEKPSVSDMIRLHFDADNKKKCELMMKSYCQYNVREKDYSPLRLKGTFKPDVDKEKEFTYGFDAKCKLQSEEDE
jgi:hypothetical protein